jgi:ATP-dependent Clp protease ATP-binding subunit ClpC
LVRVEAGVAANVLKHLNIDLQKLRVEIEKIISVGPHGVTKEKLHPAPLARNVVEYAIEEARNLNHNYVGTEHLLLGLLRDQEGVAVQGLMNLGLTLGDVRAKVLTLLGHA